MPDTQTSSAPPRDHDINGCVFSGEVTRAPQMSRTSAGVAVADLRIANRDMRRNRDGLFIHLNYIDVRVFEDDATRCCQRLRTGMRVNIQGKLDHFEIDTPVGRRSGLRVAASHVQILPRSANRQGDRTTQAPQARDPRAP
jgi:single-stranded DNA-binding protein